MRRGSVCTFAQTDPRLHCPSLGQSPVFTDTRAMCHVAYEWKIKIWFMIGEAWQYEKGKMYITHELFNLSKIWGQRTGRNKKTRKNCCYYWIQFLHLTRKGHSLPDWPYIKLKEVESVSNFWIFAHHAESMFKSALTLYLWMAIKTCSVLFCSRMFSRGCWGQEMPQSQTTNQPMAPRGRETH